jgi:hypothetical protein
VSNPANGEPEDFLKRKIKSVERGSQMGICLSDLQMVAKISAWPTTDKNSGDRGGVTEYKPTRPSGHQAQMSLNDAAKISSWPTSRATDAEKNSRTLEGIQKEIDRKGNLDELPSVAKISSWPTTNAHDGRRPGADTASTQGGNLSRYSTMAIFSSNAETTKSVVLNPEFSRWLMGFPKIWDEASPNYEDWLKVQELIAKDGSELTVMPFKSESR